MRIYQGNRKNTPDGNRLIQLYQSAPAIKYGNQIRQSDMAIKYGNQIWRSGLISLSGCALNGIPTILAHIYHHRLLLLQEDRNRSDWQKHLTGATGNLQVKSAP
jgi:hypothetical protein